MIEKQKELKIKEQIKFLKKLLKTNEIASKLYADRIGVVAKDLSITILTSRVVGVPGHLGFSSRTLATIECNDEIDCYEYTIYKILRELKNKFGYRKINRYRRENSFVL